MTLMVLAAIAKASAMAVSKEGATGDPPQGVEGASEAEFVAAADQFWSKGYGAVGHSILTNLTVLIPSEGGRAAASGNPVQYPANGSGCPSENVGADDLVSYISAMASVCPKTKFAVGGHGEGGVVAVKAIQTREDILANVIAVTILGGPACPEAVADRCRSYCNAGDTFCERARPIDDCQSEERRWVSEGLLTERADIENPLATLVAPDCSGSEPPEKGHVVGNGIDPNTGYHEDGFYVRAAACFIFNKWGASVQSFSR
ncbi:hypothetical protein FQN53_006972 [Emmonsiellopsis sp. PD_33]|nr:hypothetical protein FQN53_006972 [Emmonsiellopsis sp. PD_33]